MAGKYLYVYGDMDDDGFYEGESISVKNNVNLIKGKRRTNNEGEILV